MNLILLLVTMSMQSLVQLLESQEAITSDSVREAFLAVDRADFVREDYVEDAYRNHPLPIGHDQTISQPLTVAIMLEKLDVQRGMKVLDVGCGSGWTTALLAHMVGSEGTVVGVERIPDLVSFARNNLAAASIEAQIREAGDQLGVAQQAPFDRILVSAAADEVPQELVDQLSQDGLMVIPVGSSLLVVRRQNSGYNIIHERTGFRFVPLIS